LLTWSLKWKETKPVFLLTVGFIISRVVFRIAGVVFYGEFVKRLWQSIDVELLKTSFLESLYYSHAQPPLFNLVSGIVLKIFPVHYSLIFHIIFLVIGWLNCLLIYFSLQRFKLGVTMSFVIAFGFTLLPSVVLYENLYSYTYINVFLLTLSIYLLLTFCDKGNAVTVWMLFCTTLCLLVLLRSFYHVVWLVSIVAIVLIFFYGKTFPFKKLFISALLPVVFVLAWLVKNWLLFGAFTTSTWMGMNLARIMPPATSIGHVGPFKPIHAYSLPNTSNDFPTVKLLHQEYKTNSGFVNYYHIDYISLSDQFKCDVIKEIKSNPLEYLDHVRSAFVIYFSPASHAPFIDENCQHINVYSSIINLNFSGYKKFKRNDFPGPRALPVLTLHFVLLIGLIFCFKKGLFQKKEALVIWIMILMLGYAMIIGNFFEYGENNRFRFEHLTIFILLLSKTAYTTTQKILGRFGSTKVRED
jgi:hypothetical protein